MKSIVFALVMAAPFLHAQASEPFFRTLQGAPAEAGNVIENDGRIRKISAPVMRIFKSESTEPKGRVLLLPGGGYSILSAIKEGSETAKLLNSAGYDVAVLEYHVSASPETRDLALKDCQAAWKTVLTRPESCELRGKRTAIMGYSAGGHLAARTVMGLVGDEQPDDLILIYPAYLDEKNGEKNRVTPPEKTESRAFILIAKNDKAEWVTSSEAFSKAWSDAGGKADFHLLPDGGHGFGTKGPMADLLKNFLTTP